MIILPLKRVGEQAAFKGVKGNYLTTLMLRSGISVFIVLIGFIAGGTFIVKISVVACAVIYLLVSFNKLKENSKHDIYSQTKKYCRKKIIIKSKPFTNENKKH